jgi:hypothetical protein
VAFVQTALKEKKKKPGNVRASCRFIVVGLSLRGGVNLPSLPHSTGFYQECFFLSVTPLSLPTVFISFSGFFQFNGNFVVSSFHQ